MATTSEPRPENVSGALIFFSYILAALSLCGLISHDLFKAYQTWARSSNLFQDFAETICDDPVRFWWTQQALSFSIGWNMFMAIEGTKRGVPRLWAYFLLDQILPVSFTQNLFCLALLLTPTLKAEKKLYATNTLLQVASILAYFACVSQAPEAIASPWFFPILFATRILLFAPYLILAPSSQLSWRTPLGRSSARETLHAAYGPAWKMFAASVVMLQIRQSKFVLDDNHKSGVWEGFAIINDQPAVSALAYDYVIAMSSLYVFWATY